MTWEVMGLLLMLVPEVVAPVLFTEGRASVP
jgi:hypothetical protein